MRTGLLALAMAVLALPACSQSDPVFQIDFSNPALSPSHWTLTFHPDGSGHFRSERGSAPAESPQSLDAPNLDRDIQLSAGFAQRVFQIAYRHNWAGGECESHIKVAFQGWKKLSYSGADGQGACTFNFAKDKETQALADSLMAVSGTILEGARLEMMLAHDRLSLDREMEYLVEASGDGRIQQLCAIRGILERLAEDPDVMERVRKRALLLLARSGG
jgi:hypothetical protein